MIGFIAAFFLLLILFVLVAMMLPEIKNKVALMRWKDAKIVLDVKANKNVKQMVLRPDGNSLKYGVHKNGVKIDADNVFIDENSGRHYIIIDGERGTAINPVKPSKEEITAQLIEQSNREAAAIAVMEKVKEDDMLMRMMWGVVGVSVVVLICCLVLLYLNFGHADALHQLVLRVPMG